MAAAAGDAAPAHKFLMTLVDRIAAQWDGDEIEIPSEDFARLLRRTVNSLPDASLKTELLVHLPVWENDAWKRFTEKRQVTPQKPVTVVVPADPNLFLASGRKQLLDKLLSSRSDKTSDYDRLARAALEASEVELTTEIVSHRDTGTPAERVQRILRFAISQTPALRRSLIKPFLAATEKMPADQAAQSCQRFLPLLSQLSAPSPTLASIEALVGFYLSWLCQANQADLSRVNVMNVLFPSLSWLRAAVSITAPRPPLSVASLNLLLRVYSLALHSIPSSPSSVEYLRASLVCARGTSLASAAQRSAEERELARLHEMAAVPQSLVPLIPSLASTRPVPTAAQIYAAVVSLNEADLLKILHTAEESEAVAVPAALATVTNAVEKEEEEEAPPAPEDGALFFADRTRSERIHSRVVREESTKKNAATQAGKCDEAKTGEQDEAGEEAELLASIAKSASKLNAAAGDAEVGLSSDSEGEGDGQRKGPRAAVREAKSEDEDDDESNATTDRVTPAASAPVPTSALAAASESTKEAGKAPRNKRREADVLQAELAALGLTSELKSARTSSGRELRTRNKRGTSELAQQ